jgi:hypothetical protein
MVSMSPMRSLGPEAAGKHFTFSARAPWRVRRERDGLGRGDDLEVRYGASGVPGVSGGGGTKAHGILGPIHTHCAGAGAGGGGGGSSSASAAGEPTRAPMAAAVANATKRRRMRLMANSNLLMMRQS